jgi:integrase
MAISTTASSHTLPVLRLTKARQHPGRGLLPVDHQVAGQQVKYWRELQTDKAARWKNFAKFPLVLNADGSLWEPACLWLLDKARARPLHLSSLPSIARDLKDYKLFLDELGLAWDDFCAVDKYNRPTYLYRTHLQTLINSGSVAKSTASRRMSTVIGFYRFLMDHERMRFDPVNEPWVDRQVAFEYKDSKGFRQLQTVVTTDVSIHSSKRDYAWDATIADGGQLRPLSVEEQGHLVAALEKLGNPEYELMHYVSLLSGARVQTVLTLRWGCFRDPPSAVKQWPYKLHCGPGTGIDTKRDVTNVYLSVRRVLYERLHVYVNSDRAKHRRAKSRLGDDPSNYLFLTNRGSPYYESKDDRNAMRSPEELLKKSSPIGQNLREFMAEKVILEVRKALPQFSYSFHDLRATFAMNWVDHFVGGQDTKPNYMWARDQLRKMMWHKDATTTDRYLEYGQHMHQLEQARADWNRDLVKLIQAS